MNIFGKEIIEEYQNSEIVRTNESELEKLVCQVVDHENTHSQLPVAWMLGARASYHLIEVIDNSPGCKERTVLPSSSLFHENEESFRSIGECLSIRNVGQIEATVFFDIDLEAHDSVFGQIFVSLIASWLLVRIHELEERIHGTLLNGAPSEQAVRTWQDRVVSEETFESLVRRMTELVFVELGCS